CIAAEKMAADDPNRYYHHGVTE
ncbi:hypothetical protein A2U01_0070296, partial [Trifolium medium]|nr:hypothetical protein [Trifolium medium]